MRTVTQKKNFSKKEPMPLMLRFMEKTEATKLELQPEYGDQPTYIGATGDNMDYTTD